MAKYKDMQAAASQPGAQLPRHRVYRLEFFFDA
jgi:hypothetical protein